MPLAGGLVGGCAYGRRTPALALSRQCRWAAGILGMRRSASHSMCVAWCVWVRLWSAHTGTRLVTGSALEPLALLEGGGLLRTASALHGVYWSVCVPMVGAHRYSPGHSSALGPLALLECGGQLRTACALLCVCVPKVGAHRYSPGHGSALGPMALLERGGQLRTICALLCGFLVACGVPLASFQLQRGGMALDGCSALRLMCCEVQHGHWPCLGQCFGQLACRDSPPVWLEVGVLRGVV